jgi:hypothetical protein
MAGEIANEYSSGDGPFSKGAADGMQKKWHQLQNASTKIIFCNSPNEFCISSLHACVCKERRIHFHHRALSPERSI